MISINTNTAATSAAYNLSNTNVNLQRSLNRLSSGSRINSSFDDAGGLAVSMKLSASIRRTEATQNSVNNALSFLETQDGVLKSAEKVLSRMSELAQLGTDVTKSTNDLALYQSEVDTLKTQLGSFLNEKFNGISLFGGTSTQTGALGTDGSLTVYTSEEGSQSVAISQLNLGYLSGTTSGVGTSVSTSSGIQVSTNTDAIAAVATLTTAIQNLATLRARNGSQQQRITFAADVLAINKTNLEAANGRITDIDVATESSNLARWNILQQAGTAMLAQANQSTQSILRLLV
ncbi:MAG: flagellin [bacterium]